jgi:hypothetical protein
METHQRVKTSMYLVKYDLRLSLETRQRFKTLMYLVKYNLRLSLETRQTFKTSMNFVNYDFKLSLFVPGWRACSILCGHVRGARKPWWRGCPRGLDATALRGRQLGRGYGEDKEGVHGELEEDVRSTIR